MALLVNVDGTSLEVKGDQKDGSMGLEQFQKLVGGYIAITPILVDQNKYDMAVCDEDGDLRRLEFNPAASVLAGQRLVGPVVFCRNEEMK